VTLPIWVEDGLAAIVEKYSSKPVDQRMITELKHDLGVAGLTDLFSEALSLIGRHK
jgi:hypothetical protein